MIVFSFCYFFQDIYMDVILVSILSKLKEAPLRSYCKPLKKDFTDSNQYTRTMSRGPRS